MLKLKLIYNPSSGTQNHQDKAFIVIRKLAETGLYKISIFATQKKDDAYYQAKSACKEGYDIILACGGDGTVNEVVNGILDSEKKCKLAILAAGSVNDFSDYLGLPSDPDEFAGMIIRGESLWADVGKVHDKYFVNVAAGGAFTNIAHEVAIDTKTILGRYAYYLQGAIELPGQLDKSFPVTIQIDHEPAFNEDAFLFLVSNTTHVGGFKKMVPDAKINDQLLDFLLIKKSSKKELVEIFPKIITGQHIKHPAVIYRKAKKINLTSPLEDLVLDIDGEQADKLPALFEVLPAALEIIV